MLLLLPFVQLEPLIKAKDVRRLRDPAFAGVSDDLILHLFKLAQSCTQLTTARRPSMLKVGGALSLFRNTLYNVHVLCLDSAKAQGECMPAGCKDPWETGESFCDVSSRRVSSCVASFKMQHSVPFMWHAGC